MYICSLDLPTAADLFKSHKPPYTMCWMIQRNIFRKLLTFDIKQELVQFIYNTAGVAPFPCAHGKGTVYDKKKLVLKST